MPAAIVLAGGGPEPHVAAGLPSKAFLVIGGRPLVRRAVEALRGCSAIDRIVVVGPAEPLAQVLGDSVSVVPERDSLMDNIEAAVAGLAGVRQLLTVASDLPLLTPEVISAFLARCTDDADFHYPIVPQTAVEKRFPGARKTYVKVVDGTFTGGSILLFAPEVLSQIRPLVEQMIAARKKPWLLAQLFGWPIVMKFASGRLSIAEMEARALEVTGLRGRAVIIEAPELALDVDAGRPENMNILRAALEPPGGAGV